MGIAVQKGNQELLEQINAFLVQYKENGGYEELTEKYLSEKRKHLRNLVFSGFFDMDE